MIVKLTKDETKVMKSLDPEGKGARSWMKAREIASAVFRKKADNLEQPDIRVVRNAFRKLVREEIIEMGAEDTRGQYRISDRGRKILKSGETQFDSLIERAAPKKKAPAKKAKTAKKSPAKKAKTAKKAPVKKPAKPKKTAKRAPAKKPAKKAAPKKAGMAPPKRPSKIKVETKENSSEKPSTNNGAPKRPAFKRKNAPASFEAGAN